MYRQARTRRLQRLVHDRARQALGQVQTAPDPGPGRTAVPQIPSRMQPLMIVRIGIVGTGGMANHHALHYRDLRSVRLVACCDIDRERADAFAAKWEIPRVYDSYETMLAEEDLDGISVVTSDAAHPAVSLAAIERGIAVLCEKPLAPTLDEAARMAAAARERGAITAVNLLKRNGAGLQEASQRIARGDIGRVLHVEACYLQSWLTRVAERDVSKPIWRLTSRLGGGTLADLGPHAFDLATFLCGDIESVSCTLATYDKGVPGNALGGEPLDADDSFIASVRFTGGALGTIHCSRWASGFNDWEFIRVCGDKGAIEVDFGREAADFAEYGNRYRIFTPDHRSWTSVCCKPSPSTYCRFVRAIKTGEPPQADFDTGLRVQAYLHACRESFRLQRPVTVEPPSSEPTAAPAIEEG
ncbi:MAG: gfo/Idh/MocA family oxidoreductase [Chitinivibrionales bacterium]|nr:gfo/Idh/MocA family oxidoreductase [Chitinivibrionales bacterium]